MAPDTRHGRPAPPAPLAAVPVASPAVAMASPAVAMAAPGWSSAGWTQSYRLDLSFGVSGAPMTSSPPPRPAAVQPVRQEPAAQRPVVVEAPASEAPRPARGSSAIPLARAGRGDVSLQLVPPAQRILPSAPAPRQDVGFELPPIAFLAEPPQEQGVAVPIETLQQNAGLLEGVLEDFNVRGEIVQAAPGPVVTLYELEPAPGTKSSRVISLADDIARSMSAISARVAVVQGKNAIGIELPNVKRETVFLRELLASQDFEATKHKLALCLGKTIGGEPVIADLARMPHLLVAGTTGSGKSVAINTMILSILYRLKPEQCRLIMVDPKMLELSVYDGIPHLLT
ncbi:MAG: DNA translocase FtsK, partial [Chelatococcus sp.]